MALVTAAAWAAGAAALAGFAWTELRRFERSSLEIAAGLGIVALILSAALLAGAFADQTALLVAVAAIGAGVAWVRARARRRSAGWPVDAPRPRADPPWVRRAMFAIAVCAVAACAGAVAPVTDHDALSYVVPIARHIAADGALRVWRDQAPSMWPLGHTVLLAYIARFGGDRLAALSAIEWLVAIGAISAFARRACERSDRVPLAIALTIAAPAAAFQVSAAKEDLLLLAATAAALFCLAGPKTVREAAAAGVFAGVAAGAKYPGLGVAIGVIAWMAIGWPRRQRLRAAAAAAACAAAIGGVWYALNLWRFGNPVAPFVLGAAGTPLDAAAVRAAMQSYGGGRGVVNFFAAPLRIALEPSRYSGRAALFNPLVYAGIASLLVTRLRWRAAPFVFVAAVLYVGWFFTVQHARLLLPAALALAPAAADVLAVAVATLRAPPPAGGASPRTAAASRGLIGAIVAAAGAPLLLAPVVGLVRAERYLSDPTTYLARETEHYSGIAWANAHLDPARHRVLSAFGVVGYFTIPAVGLDSLHQLEFSAEEIADPDRLLAACRREGVTHIFAARHGLDRASSRLRMVFEDPESRLGDAHFFRRAPVEATAIFEIVSNERR